MKYDFDKEIPMRGSGAIKWDQWEDPEVLGMANADMDFRAADCIVDALKERAEYGMFNYHYKPESYYDSVVKWYKRKFGWEIKKEWLVNAPGIWVSLHICLEAYTRPGDRVIVQTPHFNPIQVAADRMGRNIVTNPMILKDGRYEIDFVDFEKKIIETRPAVYFMVNLQNPTGRLFTKEEVERLMDICCRHQVLVLSDEVHANIRFDGRTHTPAPAVSEAALNNTVILNSASKGYNVMDLTFCFMVAPNPRLRRILQETLEGYSLDFATNAFSVAATTAALGEEADQWTEDVTAYLQGNLDFVMDYFEKYIPLIKPIRPEGSFVLWLDCRTLKMNPDELQRFFVEKAKVGIANGAGYGPEGVGFERLNFGCTRKNLEEGLRRIRKAVDAYKAEE